MEKTNQDSTVRRLSFKTLTAEQIAELMEQLSKSRPATLAEMLMNDDIPEDFVVAGTGLTKEWFTGKVTPDDISKVWEAFKAANSFLSKMLPRLSAAGRLLEQLGQQNSEAQSAE